MFLRCRPLYPLHTDFERYNLLYKPTVQRREMDIKIKHGQKIYHKWHWVRRVPVRLQHKHGKRVDKSTGHSNPYAAERIIQAWDAELERSDTSIAEDYQAELERLAAFERDEQGNIEEAENLVTPWWNDIGDWNSDAENKALYDKIPLEVRMAAAADSELAGHHRQAAFIFKLQDALVVFKRDKADEKEDYYLKMYSTAVRLFTESIPEMPMAEIKRSHVRNWLKAIKQTAAKNTRLMYLSRLGQIFEYAQENENISEELANPFRGHKLGKGDEKPRIPMSDDELLLLLKATNDPWDRLPPIIARHTGMRHKEIFYSSLITVQGVVCLDIKETADGKFKTKTANSKRIVPLHSSIADLVSRLHPQLKKRNQRTHASNFSKLKRKHFPGQDDLCFHSLRHSFITYAMREEVNQVMLSELVGHATLKGRTETETRYLHGYSVAKEKALIEKVPPLDLTGIELP